MEEVNGFGMPVVSIYICLKTIWDVAFAYMELVHKI